MSPNQRARLGWKNSDDREKLLDNIVTILANSEGKDTYRIIAERIMQEIEKE